jgi:hypothetical protein
MASIFDKVRLKPTQLRTVADRRFADADALRKTRENARANAVMYLGGFVLECLLKARLLETYRWLQTRGPTTVDEARLWSLCYRSHDLAGILASLPDLSRQLAEQDLRHGGRARLLPTLDMLCAEWTVHARYSPRDEVMETASVFLSRIRELKEWLK